MSVGRIPQHIDLKLYAGDSATFGFTLTDGETGEPVDTSVGEWAAEIKPEGFGESVEAFVITLDTAITGRMDLFIDAGASQRLGTFRQNLRWDLQQTYNDLTVTTHAQGYILVAPDVTRVDL